MSSVPLKKLSFRLTKCREKGDLGAAELTLPCHVTLGGVTQVLTLRRKVCVLALPLRAKGDLGQVLQQPWKNLVSSSLQWRR